MVRTLLVEDAEEFQVLVKNALDGLCSLTIVSTAEEALKAIKQQAFELIILDIGLPDRSGHELCAELRAKKETQDTPIFILTGRSEVSDKVTSFSLGADDYIVKPFDFLEFQARVAAKIKKSLRRKELKTLFTHKNISLNIVSREVRVGAEGADQRKVDLTPHEFKLLQVLISSPDRVFSRDHLLSKVWGTDTFVEDRTVDKHISSLRKKLDSCSSYIQTVTGIGYRFSTADSTATTVAAAASA